MGKLSLFNSSKFCYINQIDVYYNCTFHNITIFLASQYSIHYPLLLIFLWFPASSYSLILQQGSQRISSKMVGCGLTSLIPDEYALISNLSFCKCLIFITLTIFYLQIHWKMFLQFLLCLDN